MPVAIGSAIPFGCPPRSVLQAPAGHFMLRAARRDAERGHRMRYLPARASPYYLCLAKHMQGDLLPVVCEIHNKRGNHTHEFNKVMIVSLYVRRE